MDSTVHLTQNQRWAIIDSLNDTIENLDDLNTNFYPGEYTDEIEFLNSIIVHLNDSVGKSPAGA